METLGRSCLLGVQSLCTKSSALRHGFLPSVSNTHGSRATSSLDQVSPAITTPFQMFPLLSPGEREDLGWTKISKGLSTKYIIVIPSDKSNEIKFLKFLQNETKAVCL